MLDELDFEKEARCRPARAPPALLSPSAHPPPRSNMAEFRAFLSTSGNRRVTVPDVYPAASAKRVLTMQRLYGKPLVDLDAIRAYTASPEVPAPPRIRRPPAAAPLHQRSAPSCARRALTRATSLGAGDAHPGAQHVDGVSRRLLLLPRRRPRGSRAPAPARPAERRFSLARLTPDA